MIDELFGGWGIDWEVFSWIISHLPKGSTILELGSGKSSAELNRYYRLHSIEHAEHYIGMYDTNYIHAKPSNNWYDVDSVRNNMVKYDLLIIDGPDHYNRKNILDHTDLFDWSKPTIIDDVQEPDLMILAIKLASDYCKRPYQIIQGSDKVTIKSFMVIP